MLFFSFLTALLRRKSPWAVTPRSAHPSSVPCGCLFGSSHSSLVHAPFLITHLREAVISGSRPVCSSPAASSIRYFFFNSDRYVDHYLCMLSSIGSTICLFFFYISDDIYLLPSINNDRHLYTPVYRLQLSFIYFLLLVRFHISIPFYWFNLHLSTQLYSFALYPSIPLCFLALPLPIHKRIHPRRVAASGRSRDLSKAFPQNVNRSSVFFFMFSLCCLCIAMNQTFFWRWLQLSRAFPQSVNPRSLFIINFFCSLFPHTFSLCNLCIAMNQTIF